MSLRSFLEQQFIDVTHWTESDTGVLAFRFPMSNMEIQSSAQLTVRESQMAVFVNEGRIADVFRPGLYTLTTRTLPLLTELKNWDKEFQSPFKSDVFFFSTRLQMDQKWGRSPHHSRKGIWGGAGAGLRHLFLPHRRPALVPHQRECHAGHEGQLRDTIMAKMIEAIAPVEVPFLDMAANLGDLSKKGDRTCASRVRHPGAGTGVLRDREHIATRRAAKVAGPAHQHEHGG
jgi:hypothetical protein